MKLIHLSDIHLGKRISEISMLDDQKFILNQIINLIKQKNADAVVIAGDIYDRPVPPPEAVNLLDEFLTNLCDINVKCLMISGNHDSNERLAFGEKLLEKSGVYMSPVFDSKIKTVTLNDEYGQIDFVLLPFLRPAQVKRYYEDISSLNESDAVKLVLENTPKREGVRRVLVAHHFVTAFGDKPEQCDSEVLSVGTLGGIDVDIIKDFNYVALGHIHKPQKIGYEHVRYAGSPLKFSFSEVNHKKSVPFVEIDADGNVNIQLIPLKPKRDMRKIKGSLQEILSPDKDEKTDDYMHITLTDDAVLDAMQKVKSVYPNTMSLEFENAQTKALDIPVFNNSQKNDIQSLFAEFFEKQNGQELSEQMKQYLHEAMGEGLF